MKKIFLNDKFYFWIGILFFLFAVLSIVFLNVENLTEAINQIRGHEVSEFGLKVINAKYLIPFKLILVFTFLISFCFACFLRFEKTRKNLLSLAKKIWRKASDLRVWQILLILFIFNFVLKGAVMFFVPETKLSADGALYIDIARSLLSGEGYKSHTIPVLSVAPDKIPYSVFDITPLFPYVLFFVFGIFGSSFLSSIFINVFFSILLPCLLFLLVFQITKQKNMAFLSAVLLSFNPILFGSMTFQVAKETLFTLLIMLCFVFVLAKKNFKNLFFVGIFCALAFLLRIEGFVLLLPIILLSFLFDGFSLKRDFKKMLFVGVIIFIVIFPWLLRNYNLTGNVFGIDSEGIVVRSLASYENHETVTNNIDISDFDVGFWEIIGLTIFKILKLIIKSPLNLIGSLVITILSLVGLVKIIKTKKEYWLIFFFILICYLFYPLFSGEIRHMEPLIPFFLFFASVGILKIFKKADEFKKQILLFLLIFVLFFNLFFGIVNAVYVPVYSGQGIENAELVSDALANNGKINIVYSGHPDYLHYKMSEASVVFFPEENLDILDLIVDKYNIDYIVLDREMSDSVGGGIESLGFSLIHTSEPNPNILIKIYKK